MLPAHKLHDCQPLISPPEHEYTNQLKIADPNDTHFLRNEGAVGVEPIVCVVVTSSSDSTFASAPGEEDLETDISRVEVVKNREIQKGGRHVYRLRAPLQS